MAIELYRLKENISNISSGRLFTYKRRPYDFASTLNKKHLKIQKTRHLSKSHIVFFSFVLFISGY